MDLPGNVPLHFIPTGSFGYLNGLYTPLASYYSFRTHTSKSYRSPGYSVHIESYPSLYLANPVGQDIHSVRTYNKTPLGRSFEYAFTAYHTTELLPLPRTSMKKLPKMSSSRHRSGNHHHQTTSSHVVRNQPTGLDEFHQISSSYKHSSGYSVHFSACSMAFHRWSLIIPYQDCSTTRPSLDVSRMMRISPWIFPQDVTSLNEPSCMYRILHSLPFALSLAQTRVAGCWMWS